LPRAVQFIPLRGIRVYESSESDFRVSEEESGMAW